MLIVKRHFPLNIFNVSDNLFYICWHKKKSCKTKFKYSIHFFTFMMIYFFNFADDCNMQIYSFMEGFEYFLQTKSKPEYVFSQIQQVTTVTTTTTTTPPPPTTTTTKECNCYIFIKF